MKELDFNAMLELASELLPIDAYKFCQEITKHDHHSIVYYCMEASIRYPDSILAKAMSR